MVVVCFTEAMEIAAQRWRVELQDRSFTGWKKLFWAVRSVAGGVNESGPDIADLVFIAVNDETVAHRVAAGDAFAADRLLGTARQELLTMTSQQFAAEWGVPLATS